MNDAMVNLNYPRQRLELIERSNLRLRDEITNPLKTETKPQIEQPHSIKEALIIFKEKLGRELRVTYEVDEKNRNRSIVKITDRNTNELVLQVPSDSFISMSHNISEYLDEHRAGFLIDEMV